MAWTSKSMRANGPAGGARLGVVVVSYNTVDLLDRCLSSLVAELPRAPSPADVWVVDNASRDGSADMVRERHGWARLLALHANVGYAAAANIALRAFMGQRSGPAPEGPPTDWSLVLNADAALEHGALAGLISALSDDPRAAVAGPRLRFPDGRFQHGAFRFPGLMQTWLDLFPQARLADSALNGRYPPRLYDSGLPFVVDFPLGACMLVRTAAMRGVGLMDEGFFLYCEEVDWCRRFRAAGHIALCVPEAVVTHHSGASTGPAGPSVRAALWQSRLRYFAKHEPAWRYALLAVSIHVGLALRAQAVVGPQH